MWWIRYPRGYQILHVGRILHVIPAMERTTGYLRITSHRASVAGWRAGAAGMLGRDRAARWQSGEQ